MGDVAEHLFAATDSARKNHNTADRGGPSLARQVERWYRRRPVDRLAYDMDRTLLLRECRRVRTSQRHAITMSVARP